MKQKKVKGRKKQRKLLLAILMLLLTGGLLATTSYAWFTANKTVTVSTINVNVAAANGLQISVDGVNWKAIVTNDDIKATIDDAATAYPTNTNQLPDSSGRLAPVSTVGNLSSRGFMDMYLGEVVINEATGAYELTASKTEETKSKEGHFIAFDLFFQVQEDTKIYLTDKASVKGGTGLTDTGIQRAARLAFIDEGNTAAGSATSTIQNLANASATPIFWEPNYDVHTPTGIANAAIYGKTTSANGAARLGYYGVKAPFSTGVALNSTDANYFQEVTTDTAAPANYIATPESGIPAAAYQEFLDLKKGITKIRIYMWVEGQDVDCENFASGGQINFDLQFSSNSKAGGTDVTP